MLASEKRSLTWGRRLDWVCVAAGALVPVGIVLGNIGFESLVSLTGLSWVIRSFLVRDDVVKRIWKHPLVIPWVAWFAIIVLSLLWNGPGRKGWAHDVVFVRYLLFGLALIDVSHRISTVKYLTYGLIAGVILAAVNTAVAYMVGFDLLGKPLLRYTGKLKEASRISGLAAYAAAFFVAAGIRDKIVFDKNRIALLGIGLLALLQVFQTRVRTALIGAMVGILFAMAYGVRKNVRPRNAIVSGVVLVTVVGLYFHIWNSWSLESFYDRVYHWKVAWAMWLANPILGVGVSSFQNVYREMASSGTIAPFVAPNGTVWQLGEVMHAHSLILTLGASTGLLGLTAFFWLFLNASRLIYKEPRGWRFGLIAWPVAFLVVGITGFNIYHSWYQALVAYFLVFAGVVSDTSGKEALVEKEHT